MTFFCPKLTYVLKKRGKKFPNDKNHDRVGSLNVLLSFCLNYIKNVINAQFRRYFIAWILFSFVLLIEYFFAFQLNGHNRLKIENEMTV